MTGLVPAWALESTDAYQRYLDTWSGGFNSAWSMLAPKVARAEADADYWFYVANNPAEARAAHAAQLAFTLDHMDTLAARDREAIEQALMGRLEHADPVKYSRLALLRLTDRAAFRAALHSHDWTRA